MGDISAKTDIPQQMIIKPGKGAALALAFDQGREGAPDVSHC